MYGRRQIKLCGLAVLGLALPWQRLGARQDVRAQAALGPAIASVAKVAGRVGQFGQREHRRAHQCRIYPAQQLGKAFDHYDMARDGIADLTYVSPGYQPGRFPIFDAADLPSCCPTPKPALGATRRLVPQIRRDRDEGREVLLRLRSGSQQRPFPHQENRSARRHSGHEDPAGSCDMASLVTALGGTNVQAAAPEVRDVIGKGVADAVAFPWGSIVLFGIDKVTKNHMEAAALHHWLRLGDEQGHLRSDVGVAAKGDRRPLQRAWAEKIAAPWADFEHDGIAKLKAEPDHEVYFRSLSATRDLESGDRARGANLVGRRDKGGRRSRRGAEGPQEAELRD